MISPRESVMMQDNSYKKNGPIIESMWLHVYSSFTPAVWFIQANCYWFSSGPRSHTDWQVTVISAEIKSCPWSTSQTASTSANINLFLPTFVDNLQCVIMYFLFRSDRRWKWKQRPVWTCWGRRVSLLKRGWRAPWTRWWRNWRTSAGTTSIPMILRSL